MGYYDDIYSLIEDVIQFKIEKNMSFSVKYKNLELYHCLNIKDVSESLYGWLISPTVETISDEEIYEEATTLIHNLPISFYDNDEFNPIDIQVCKDLKWEQERNNKFFENL